MDSYAQRPQELAVQSQKSGFFDRAIAPVTLADGTVVATDDGPRASSTLEKLSQLPEAFAGGGGVTADVLVDRPGRRGACPGREPGAEHAYSCGVNGAPLRSGRKAAARTR